MGGPLREMRNRKSRSGQTCWKRRRTMQEFQSLVRSSVPAQPLLKATRILCRRNRKKEVINSQKYKRMARGRPSRGFQNAGRGMSLGGTPLAACPNEKYSEHRWDVVGISYWTLNTLSSRQKNEVRDHWSSHDVLRQKVKVTKECIRAPNFSKFCRPGCCW